MTDAEKAPPSDDERFERLERSVWRLKIGLSVVSIVLAAAVFPPIHFALGIVLIGGLIGGSVVFLIGSLIRLFEKTLDSTNPSVPLSPSPDRGDEQPA